MNNLNSILVEGFLIKDAVFKTTPKGMPVCTFTIATSRYYGQENGFEKEVSFFDIETWGELAKSCESKGKKDKGVRIVGRLKQDRWVAYPNGKECSRVKILAEHVEFRPEFIKDGINENKTDETDDDYNEEVDIDDDIKESLSDEAVTEAQSLF
jgi:single-strand DNA-binding protein